MTMTREELQKIVDNPEAAYDEFQYSDYVELVKQSLLLLDVAEAAAEYRVRDGMSKKLYDALDALHAVKGE